MEPAGIGSMMRMLLLVPLVLLGGCAARAPAAAPEGGLLDPRRIEALPAEQRRAWSRYLAESRRLAELDRASMRAELAALGRERWTPATEGANYVIDDGMTEEWFRGAEARAMADNVLSFQTPSGGWSKRLDLRTRPRQPGESYSISSGWDFIPTFDNDATTEHLRFLASAYRAHADERYRDAFLRGLEYVLRAQFPNGCWPQVFPLQGGYHDAATFNDETMMRILRLLRDVAGGEYGFVPAGERQRAEAGVRRGVECILDSQVVVDGRRTVWGAQHDPLSLVPVKARAYEHPSLSGGESAAVMEFLMEIDSPDPRVVEAVHAAADWFRESAIYGYEYMPKGELIARQGAGPIWARFYEIGTNRPIFSDRDGIVRYRWDEIGEERRFGYSWYRRDPAQALKRYEAWAKRHPRP